MEIQPLRNLNDICNKRKPGIYKRWVYKDDCFMPACDFMEKIKYSVEDLNSMIKGLSQFDRKNLVYVIVLVEWVIEAYEKIRDSLKDDVIKNFVYEDESSLKLANKYFRAVRSFVVAHPLSTNRHPKFDLDGNYICVDMVEDFLIKDDNDFLSLDFDGMHKATADTKKDFYLVCYSKKDDNMSFRKKICCNYSDLFQTASLYIDKLYKLDEYLSKMKRANFN